MKKKGTDIQGTIFLSWLISYTVILLIPVITGIIIFYNAGDIVESETNRVNSVLLNQLTLTIDNNFENITHISKQIATNPRLLEFLNPPGNNEKEKKYLLFSIIKDFEVLEKSNLYIDLFYVYIKKEEKVISASGYKDADIFYTLFHKIETFPFGEWKKLMEAPHNREFYQIRKLTNSKESIRTIACLSKIPENSLLDVSATIVILLDTSYILKFINETLHQESTCIITNHLGEEVIYSGKSGIDINMLNERMTGLKGMFKIKGTKQEYYASFQTSRVTGWKYISFVPVTIYHAKTKSFQTLIIIGLIFALICGLLVAYILTKKHYKPVRKLLEIISDDISLYSESRLDEFKLISETISQTMEMKKKLNISIEQQNTILAKNWIRRIIEGQREAGDEAIHSKLVSLGVSFNSDDFIILLVSVENKNTGESITPRLLQQKMVVFLQSILSQTGSVVIIELSDYHACIINLNQPDRDKKTDLKTLHSRLKQELHVSTTIGVSTIRKGVSKLREQYDEAKKALEYKLVRGIDRIIYFTEIENPDTIFQYDLATEQMLINSIKTGNTADSLAIIDKVYNNNFHNRRISIDMARCLVFNLVSTMIKTMNESRIDNEATFWNDLKPIERLLACQTAESIKKKMSRILKIVCEKIEASKKSHNILLKDRILAYIDKNIKDINLYAASIAEIFQMNQSYFCRFFKEQTGESITSFINRKRIDHSKDLLHNEKMKISDIARELGFSSDRAFIRIFKKIEGITPGKFREMEK
ncbi:MAG: helix-turn-helix domain-containing protein [Spirochaetales bacterium]|nr:helix-turn-helix domain-containing protein [Spirochaetales bacterium]